MKNGSKLGKRTHFAERQKLLPDAMPARPSLSLNVVNVAYAGSCVG